MTELAARQLALAYGTNVVVSQLSLSVAAGKITAMIGPNGSGKSTILKALARLLQPRGGAAYLDGKAIHRMPSREVARQLAVLPQRPTAPDSLTVRQLIGYGRLPHQKTLRGPSQQDRDAVDRVLDVTAMRDLADRPIGELSGGQRQRAWIAMAIAQDTSVLLLDEPTTFLDMSHQLEVLQLLRRINAEHGRTIVMVLHDLNQASRFAHEIVAITDGRVATQGPPDEVIRPAVLKQVFGVAAHVIECPTHRVPLCLPYAVESDADADRSESQAGHPGRDPARPARSQA